MGLAERAGDDVRHVAPVAIDRPTIGTRFEWQRSADRRPCRRARARVTCPNTSTSAHAAAAIHQTSRGLTAASACRTAARVTLPADTPHRRGAGPRVVVCAVLRPGVWGSLRMCGTGICGKLGVLIKALPVTPECSVASLARSVVLSRVRGSHCSWRGRGPRDPWAGNRFRGCHGRGEACSIVVNRRFGRSGYGW